MKTNHLPIWATGLLLAATLLSSCKKDLEQTVPTQAAIGIHSDSTGVIKHGTFRGIPITYEEKNGQALLEGDILLSKNDLAPVQSGAGIANARVNGAGMINHNYKWSNWTIPYWIASNLDQSGVNLNEAVIKEAMQHWEANTPIRFVPYSNQKDYVIFIKDNHNSSSIGKQGGGQFIRLTPDTDVATVIHEIGHAVGLYHEQSRRDRDNYINIHWDNIIEKYRHNFNRWPIGEGFDYGAFDYESIMMYWSHGFSQNGQPTITRKDGLTWTPGNRLSPDDISTVISMYSNLYFVMGDDLYAVNEQNGSRTRLGAGWVGAAKTLAQDDKHIWAIQGGKLWKTFRFNGGYEQVGTDDWTGAKVMTGLDAQGNFYAIYQTKIWKVDKYGNRTKLPGIGQWGDAEALYYHNNALYVAIHNDLRKINTITGAFEKKYSGSWFDVKGIAAVQGSSDFIYVMRKDALFRVNTVTGEVAGGEYFADVKAMTARSGYLYIVSGNDLIKMDEFSNKKKLTNDWAGTTSVSAY